MAISESEMVDWVRDSLVTRLATLSPQGVPLVTPIWFVNDGEDLLMTTGGRGLAVRNILAHPRVVLLFDAELRGRQPRALRVVGEASFESDFLRPLSLLRIARKYYLRRAALRVELANAARWRMRARYYAQHPEPGFIRVRPLEWEWVEL